MRTIGEGDGLDGDRWAVKVDGTRDDLRLAGEIVRADGRYTSGGSGGGPAMPAGWSVNVSVCAGGDSRTLLMTAVAVSGATGVTITTAAGRSIEMTPLDAAGVDGLGFFAAVGEVGLSLREAVARAGDGRVLGREDLGWMRSGRPDRGAPTGGGG